MTAKLNTFAAKRNALLITTLALIRNNLGLRYLVVNIIEEDDQITVWLYRAFLLTTRWCNIGGYLCYLRAWTLSIVIILDWLFGPVPYTENAVFCGMLSWLATSQMLLLTSD